MRLVSRFFAGGSLAVTAGWALTLALLGSTDALFFMAPALLIAVPLFAGRYLGESLIERLARRRDRPHRRRTAAGPSLPRLGAPVGPPRGARLIAFSLAKRPPPAALLPQS